MSSTKAEDVNMSVKKLRDRCVRLGLDSKGNKRGLSDRLVEYQDRAVEEDRIEHVRSASARAQSRMVEQESGAVPNDQVENDDESIANNCDFVNMNRRRTVRNICEISSEDEENEPLRRRRVRTERHGYSDDSDDDLVRRNSHGSKKQASFSFRDIDESFVRFGGTEKENVTRWILEFEDHAEMLAWNKLEMLMYAKRLLVKEAKLFVDRELKPKTWKALKKL